MPIIIPAIKGIDINILDAWKITQGSSDIVVGVLDSGVQIESDFIKENIFINSKEIPGNGKDDDLSLIHISEPTRP